VSEPTWVRVEGHEPNTIADVWLLRLRRQRFRSRRTGLTRDLFQLEAPDGVIVVALTPQRRLVMVEQFRAGSEADSLEPPGGMIDAGESAEQAAIRELTEETGYQGDAPRLLGTFWANPALLTMRITIMLVTNARPVGEPRPDDGEELRVQEVADARIPRLIRDGRIDHGLAVESLLLWLLSEIPHLGLSQTETGPRPYSRRSIAALMVAVAVAARVAAAGRGGGAQSAVTLFGAFSLVIAALAVYCITDPMPQSLILRRAYLSRARRTMRVLASVGLATIITMAMSILWAAMR
jgi:8-oxo-dGTP pyrophosphatase MutT (NUDIX family)